MSSVIIYTYVSSDVIRVYYMSIIRLKLDGLKKRMRYYFVSVANSGLRIYVIYVPIAMYLIHTILCMLIVIKQVFTPDLR